MLPALMESLSALDKARDHVARTARLVDRQQAIVEALERSGGDTRTARILLYTMYRSRLLIIDHLDQLELANCRRLGVEFGARKRPGELHEWVQLLTLAVHPTDSPYERH